MSFQITMQAGWPETKVWLGVALAKTNQIMFIVVNNWTFCDVCLYGYCYERRFIVKFDEDEMEFGS